ncbi:hypothetical protein GDO86_006444 [Hymenochirus boettgeri]|uniref:Uncharacterized protein n=1 Tax=Hymenochirus boettgeri TaxID=247094 RepID=A0A8T2JB42_9PIPI|nr:hypothetical protein GDO86_006444 [Hymenochirus boettgeri]
MKDVVQQPVNCLPLHPCSVIICYYCYWWGERVRDSGTWEAAQRRREEKKDLSKSCWRHTEREERREEGDSTTDWAVTGAAELEKSSDWEPFTLPLSSPMAFLNG